MYASKQKAHIQNIACDPLLSLFLWITCKIFRCISFLFLRPWIFFPEWEISGTRERMERNPDQCYLNQVLWHFPWPVVISSYPPLQPDQKLQRFLEFTFKTGLQQLNKRRHLHPRASVVQSFKMFVESQLSRSVWIQVTHPLQMMEIYQVM